MLLFVEKEILMKVTYMNRVDGREELSPVKDMDEDGTIDIGTDCGQVKLRILVRGEKIVVIAKEGRMEIESTRTCPTVIVNKI